MSNVIHAAEAVPPYELVFADLFGRGPCYAFPCDASGNVDLDLLGERARNSYFYARAVVGNSLSYPVVQPRRPARSP